MSKFFASQINCSFSNQLLLQKGHKKGDKECEKEGGWGKLKTRVESNDQNPHLT